MEIKKKLDTEMYPGKIVYCDSPAKLFHSGKHITWDELNGSIDNMGGLKRERLEDMGMAQISGSYLGMAQDMQGLASQQIQNGIQNGLLDQLNRYRINNAGNLVGGQFGGQYPNNPQTIPYPGLRDAFAAAVGRSANVVQLAAEHGFTFDFDSDCWKHKNGGYVSKLGLDGLEWSEIIKKFIDAKMPNLAWLDSRVEEIRVRL